MTEPYRGATTALATMLEPELDLGLDDEAPNDLLGLPGVAEKLHNRGNAGKGRAKGSRNRRTSELIAYINRRDGSPVEILMQMARAPVAELSQELHCSRFDAYRTKQAAVIAVTPYLTPRLASLEVLPPGAPGGEPSPLILVSPDGAWPQVEHQDEDAAIEAAPELAGQPVAETASVEAANRAAALLAESDVEGPRSSTTLALAPQDPAEAVASENQVDIAVDRALDALRELMRGDPEQARQIRARLASMLG